jgi:hypothetical protein
MSCPIPCINDPLHVNSNSNSKRKKLLVVARVEKLPRTIGTYLVEFHRWRVKSVRSIGLGVGLRLQYRRKLFLIGELKARAKGPRKFLNLESLKCHFLDFGADLTEFWWSENNILVCRNLQFSSTKWAKVYLINYILDKLKESTRNIFILCSLSWIM